MLCLVKVQSLGWKPETEEAEFKSRDLFPEYSTENPQVNKAFRSFISTVVSLHSVDLKALQTTVFQVWPGLCSL